MSQDDLDEIRRALACQREDIAEITEVLKSDAVEWRAHSLLLRCLFDELTFSGILSRDRVLNIHLTQANSGKGSPVADAVAQLVEDLTEPQKKPDLRVVPPRDDD